MTASDWFIIIFSAVCFLWGYNTGKVQGFKEAIGLISNFANNISKKEN